MRKHKRDCRVFRQLTMFLLVGVMVFGATSSMPEVYAEEVHLEYVEDEQHEEYEEPTWIWPHELPEIERFERDPDYVPGSILGDDGGTWYVDGLRITVGPIIPSDHMAFDDGIMPLSVEIGQGPRIFEITNVTPTSISFDVWFGFESNFSFGTNQMIFQGPSGQSHIIGGDGQPIVTGGRRPVEVFGLIPGAYYSFIATQRCLVRSWIDDTIRMRMPFQSNPNQLIVPVMTTGATVGGTVSVPNTPHWLSAARNNNTTWSFWGGNTPPGLSITSNGWIQGTPTVAGRFDFGVMVISNIDNNQWHTRRFSVYIEPASMININFHPNGGTLVPNGGTRTITAGTALANQMPANPSRANHRFDGWITGDGGWVSSSTVLHRSETLWAQWSFVAPTTATITFRANEGRFPQVTGFSDEIGFEAIDLEIHTEEWGHEIPIAGMSFVFPDVETARITIPVGNTLGELPRPFRPNHNQIGWSNDRFGGSLLNMDVPFDRDTTVYAQWVTGGMIGSPPPHNFNNYNGIYRIRHLSDALLHAEDTSPLSLPNIFLSHMLGGNVSTELWRISHVPGSNEFFHIEAVGVLGVGNRAQTTLLTGGIFASEAGGAVSLAAPMGLPNIGSHNQHWIIRYFGNGIHTFANRMHSHLWLVPNQTNTGLMLSHIVDEGGWTLQDVSYPQTWEGSLLTSPPSPANQARLSVGVTDSAIRGGLDMQVYLAGRYWNNISSNVSVDVFRESSPASWDPGLWDSPPGNGMFNVRVEGHNFHNTPQRTVLGRFLPDDFDPGDYEPGEDISHILLGDWSWGTILMSYGAGIGDNLHPNTTREERETFFIHELGHALKLHHPRGVLNPISIMHGNIDSPLSSRRPAPFDRFNVISRWGR